MTPDELRQLEWRLANDDELCQSLGVAQTAYLRSLVERDSKSTAKPGMFDPSTGRFITEDRLQGKTRFEGDGLRKATRYSYVEVTEETT